MYVNDIVFLTKSLIWIEIVRYQPLQMCTLTDVAVPVSFSGTFNKRQLDVSKWTMQIHLWKSREDFETISDDKSEEAGTSNCPQSFQRINIEMFARDRYRE